MYRLSYMTNQWYAIKIESIEDDLENIQTFTDEFIPVMIVADLDDLPFDDYVEVVE